MSKERVAERVRICSLYLLTAKASNKSHGARIPFPLRRPPSKVAALVTIREVGHE
jgi:hypothetical protein